MKTKEVCQRFPEDLLKRIDTWCELTGNSNRTYAVNLMCQTFLDNLTIESQKEEIKELQTMIVKLAMIQREA